MTAKVINHSASWQTRFRLAFCRTVGFYTLIPSAFHRQDEITKGSAANRWRILLREYQKKTPRHIIASIQLLLYFLIFAVRRLLLSWLYWLWPMAPIDFPFCSASQLLFLYPSTPLWLLITPLTSVNTGKTYMLASFIAFYNCMVYSLLYGQLFSHQTVQDQEQQ